MVSKIQTQIKLENTNFRKFSLQLGRFSLKPSPLRHKLLVFHEIFSPIITGFSIRPKQIAEIHRYLQKKSTPKNIRQVSLYAGKSTAHI